MTTPDLNEARRLADQLNWWVKNASVLPDEVMTPSAAMLRALADELERLRQAAELDLRDDVIESLKGDLAQERALCEERGRRLDEQGEELERLRAQVAPAGYKLVAVKGFDDLMYWLDRCESKGHLENCYDLIEPWSAFDWREVPSSPGAPAQQAEPNPAVPLSAIRTIAVEAIRAVTGCPDIKGNEGRYLVDELEAVAKAAAVTLKEPTHD